MALLGRESQADRDRRQRAKAWVVARTPFALYSCMFGILAVLDFFTLVLGIGFGVGAIICAYLGLSDLQVHAQRMGGRLCVVGMVLGMLGILLSLGMWWWVY